MRGPSRFAGTPVLNLRGPMAQRCPHATRGSHLRSPGRPGSKLGRSVWVLVLIVLLTACAPRGAQDGRGSSGESPVRNTPKRLVTAITAEPAALHRALIGGAVTEAKEIAFNIVNMGLTVVDETGARRPTLAEAVPTLENGLSGDRPSPAGRSPARPCTRTRLLFTHCEAMGEQQLWLPV